ncbi:MAG: hypothetical protein HRT46_11545, partial [Deltaproteobacteria bacterium]|nr:hypothetical protein [Deltaproteobacteria bacterium]
MNKVKITLFGHAPREVFFKDGEGIMALTERLGSPDWPVHNVLSWGIWTGPGPRPGNGLQCVNGDTYYTKKEWHSPIPSGSHPEVTPEVTVAIGGDPIRIARILPEETLRAFATRVHSPEFPTSDVQPWWMGLALIEDERRYVLEDGMHLSGDPLNRQKHSGPRDAVAGMVTFMVTGRAPKRVCFKTGDTLETLLEQEDAHPHNAYVDGRPAPEPELLLLRNGMKIATDE